MSVDLNGQNNGNMYKSILVSWNFFTLASVRSCNVYSAILHMYHICMYQISFIVLQVNTIIDVLMGSVLSYYQYEKS